MFDVQNFVSFTNSRLATKNFIDYVLLVQFSRFISSCNDDFYIIQHKNLNVNKFLKSFFGAGDENRTHDISLEG